MSGKRRKHRVELPEVVQRRSAHHEQMAKQDKGRAQQIRIKNQPRGR